MSKKNDVKLLLKRVVTGEIPLEEALLTLGISAKKAQKKLKKYFQWDPTPRFSPETSLQIETPIISQHLIAGRWIVPAAYMLAHAAATAEEKLGLNCCEIRNLIFKRPPEVKGDYAIETRLKPSMTSSQSCPFVFLAAGEEMAEGTLESLRGDMPALAPETMALPCFRADDFYTKIRPLGYAYGPGLRVIERFATLDSFRIYRLEARLKNQPKGLIQPFLLDGIFQAILHASEVEPLMRREHTLFLPYKIQALRLFQPMPENCFCVIDNDSLKVSEKELVATARVYAEDGSAVLELERMTLTKLTQELTNPSDVRFTAGGIHAYAQAWVASAAPQPAPLTGQWLILEAQADPLGKTRQDLRDHLLKAGLALTVATPGDSFSELTIQTQANNARLAERRFSLPFQDPDAWTRLLEQLDSQIALTIVFLPSFAPQSEPFSRDAEPALAAALALFRALTRAHRKCRIRVLSCQALAVQASDSVRGYAYAGFAGLLRTLRLECGIDAALLDLENEAELLPLVLLESQATEETLIAYRQGIRQVSSYLPIPYSHAEPIALKAGVYLITGGAGGIGRKLSNYLAARHSGLHFAWLGRSPLDRDKEEAMRAVRALGAEVTYFKTDITHEASLRSCLEVIRPLGPIRAILHSGGSNEEALIQSKDWRSFERVYNGKALGIELLDRLSADLPLDFFIAFASTIGITGSVGQCDYAAANAFLDSFIHHRRRLVAAGQRSGASFSFDWTLWNDGGMGLEDSIRAKFVKRSGVIRSTLAFPLFERVLNGANAQVIVAGNDQFFQSRAATAASSPAPSAAAQTAPSGKTQGKAQAKAKKATRKSSDTGMEAAVIRFVSQVLSQALVKLLSLDEGDLDGASSLRELGLDSVTIFSLSSQVEDELGVVFDATLLYEMETIREVAERVARTEGKTLAEKFSLLALAGDEIGEEQDAEEPIALPKSWSEPEHFQPGSVNDIAIIGLAGRYPGTDDIEAYWRMMVQAKDMISEIPADRWDWRQYFGDPKESEDSRTNSKWGGFLNNIRRFDAGFFRISPREAELMDPQQRLLMEEAWHAIEDAGYRASDLANSNTGVFVGISNDDYSNLLNQDHVKKQVYTATGSYLSIASNRISFYMGLHGPSLSMDAACASSLVAICQAISALRAGECPMAIAGGVNLCITPRRFMAFSHAGMLSQDGRCKTFDRAANGYVRGEGVGLIVLKPAEQALADGDYIYGIIKGSRTNHGGLNTTITAPNAQAQADLIVTAVNQGGLDPDGITLMEAHGTGTSLGDPLEIRGLKKAFETLYEQQDRPMPTKPHIAVGAAKSHIGHLEAASGVAGLTKVLLSMKYGKIPKNLHFHELNPAIRLDDSPLYIPKELQEWAPHDANGQPIPKRAGVSSFGFGGANAHVMVESHDNHRQACLKSETPLPFPLSATSPEALRLQALRLASYLADAKAGLILPEPNLYNIAYTLQAGRDAHEFRALVLAADLETLIQRLEAVASFEAANPAALDSIWMGEARKKRKGATETPQEPQTLSSFCQAWVQGASFDAEQLTPGQRTPLPGYCFLGEEYWIPEAKTKQPEPARDSARSISALGFDLSLPLHPLVQRDISGVAGKRYLTRLTGDEFFLADHHVSGNKVLPGTAYLEIARAAAELAGLGSPRLHQVHWAAPLLVAEPQNLEIRISADGEQHSFEVLSRGDLIHASGQLVASNSQNLSGIADFSALAARCPQRLEVRDFYARLKKLGLEIAGGAFQTIQAIRVGENEVVAELALADNLSLDGYGLHPALLDGAFQSCYALFFRAADERLQVPFALEMLRLHAPLTRQCKVYTRCGKLTAKGVATYEIRIYDLQGKLLAELDGFVPRPFSGQAENKRPAATADFLPIDPAQPLLLPQWLPATPATRQASGDARILLFDTDEERWQMLSQQSSKALWIRPGASFRACEPGVFEIHPTDLEDYRALIRHVSGLDGELSELIYLWGAEHENSYLGAETLAEGIFSPLFLLCKALGSELPKNRARIAIPFRQELNERAAAHQALAGFARSLAKERPAPTLVLLALADARDPDPERWIDAARLALSWQAESGALFRLEHKTLSQRLFRPAANEGANTQGATPKSKGVYLITGGRGALGSYLAKELARDFAAQILLSGTGPADQKTNALLAELTRLGGQAAYLSCELSDHAAVTRLVEESKKRYGRIDGIFHLAGKNIDQNLSQKELAQIREVFAPKLSGLLNLDQATADLDLDFFVCFSSLVPLLGVAGQTDYAYANAFMDSFIPVRNQKVSEGWRQGLGFSLNWPHWREGGMRLEPQTEAWFRQVSGLRPLASAEGINLLWQVLQKGWTQAAIAPAERQSESEPTEAQPIPTASIDRDALMAELAGQIRAVLGIKKLDPNKSLDDYGADSINLSELTNNLNKHYGLKLTPVLFFDLTTLAALTDYLLENHLPALEKSRQAQAIKLPPAVPIAPPGQNRPSTASASTAENSAPRPVEPPAVAIVGMAGIMPGSKDLDTFWQYLLEGRDLVGEVPPERWDWRFYEGDPATDANKTCSRWGGFMPGVEHFDYGFFGISKREAMLMDPQQRLLMMLSWNAIENAGHRAKDLAGSATGVFMGVSTFDYYDLMKNHQLDVEAHTSTGVVHSILANRISWYFDLTGPSFPIDTACSSSLIALHQAMEAIASGSCEQALVGGVNLLVSPTIHISFGKAGMLSPNGRCKTFDASADGYVRSEGAGVVYLKPLKAALADGDRIHGVIRGSAVNHGGHAKSLTAPNPKAQADLIARAMKQAGFEPQTLTYIEAHGTGTSLGDPIEIHGLKKAFERRFQECGSKPRGKQWCGIGSIKTQIGHLEAGAGIAGLFKILLGMKHGKLPGNLHQNKRNPYIELEDSPFYLLDQARDWTRLRDEAGNEIPRRAGISSFGFGGANAHVMLEEHLENQGLSPSKEPVLLVLSARDEERLRERARDLAAALSAEVVPNLDEVAYTLQIGREPMKQRLALVATTADEARARLARFAETGQIAGRAWTGEVAEEPPELAETALQRGDLDAIGQAFVDGAEVQWSKLARSQKLRRTHLPGYPFAPTHCWLPLSPDFPPEGGVPALRGEKQAASPAPQQPRPALPSQTTWSSQGSQGPLGSQASPATQRLADFLKGFEQLENLAIRGLCSALLEMGVLQPKQARYDWPTTKPADLAPNLYRLFDALPYLFAQQGLGEYNGTQLNFGNPDFAAAASNFDLAAEAAALNRTFPALGPHIRLLRTCLTQLPELLRGQVRATDLLFPNASDELVAGIYRDNPHADHLNRLLAERLVAIAQSAQPNQPLRILEVGAGTGGTTGQALAALAATPGLIYSYTDVSHYFLEMGRSRFENAAVQLEYKILDLERDPIGQGFQAKSFDAILAANVLHATKNVGATLQRLVQLLRPGGQLLINELTRGQAFITLTFGLLEGWWRFDASEKRLNGSPLLSTGLWRKALALAGFEQSDIFGDEAQGSVLQQHIIQAAMPSISPNRAPQPEERQSEPFASAAPATGSAPQPERKAQLKNRIQEILEENLRLALRETGAIPLEKPFAELGIDSIFGVELIGRLNKAFGLSLKPSLLFDYPSPLKFANHILATQQQALQHLIPAAPAAPVASAISATPPAPSESATPLASRMASPAAPPSQQSLLQTTRYSGQAILVEGPDFPERMYPRLVPIQEPGPEMVLIRVHNFSINYGDLLCIKGFYPTMPDYPFTPGMEVAGEILALGPGVKDFRVGDRVVALMGNQFGGHAELALASSNWTAKIPAKISTEEAVAFPVGFLIMNRALSLADALAGERVLIQSAASGVGVIGVQLALQRGAEVFATASSEEKLQLLRSLGVQQLINYHETDFEAEILRRTQGKGLDVVINSLSGDAIQKGLNLLAPNGRYVEIAMLAQRKAQPLDLTRLVDNQSYFSIDLRRYLKTHPLQARRAMSEMVQALAARKVKPVVAKRFSFDQIREAYAWSESRKNLGRVVVAVPQAHKQGTERERIEEIAVIGMAGRFPLASDLAEFWRNLAQGRNCVTQVPETRWSLDEHYDPKPRTPGKSSCKFGGFLSDIELFDAAFFNLSGAEAARMDPQQRLFLETAWQALEQAGHTQAKHQRCGVFVGAGVGDYQHRFLSKDAPPTAHVFSGNQASILAARIAYHLDLHGPALAVDTACSASLVAVHLACESIRSGESEIALAGGVFVSVTPNFHILSSQMGMLSPKGHCAAFDEDADGFVPGEGVGAIVLKPLAKALADGDTIWGLIRATGMNQDGATNGITAPSPKSQTELEREVLRKAGIRASELSYIETHGTGTKLGDPIEVEALCETFAAEFSPENAKADCCVALGSVKSNIGHAATAAGIASLSKVLLALHHKQLPPSLHFQNANPMIPFERTPFYVNTELCEWPEPASGTRIAAVSSFGFSGTNAHIIVAEAPGQPRAATQEPFPTLVVFSGLRQEELLQHVHLVASQIAELERNGQPPRLQDLAYTLGARRTHFPERTLFLVSSLDELRMELTAYMLGSGNAICGKVDETSDFSAIEARIPLLLGQRQQGGQAWKNALLELAKAYVKGFPFNWQTLFEGEETRNLPLPGYPLNRRRHWIEAHGSQANPSPTTPAAQTNPVSPTTRKHARPLRFPFTNQLQPELFFVQDHKVEGRPLLPGVAYLELAAAQAEQRNQPRLQGFRDLTFLRPLFVEKPQTIQLDTDNYGGFTLSSQNGEEEHARGVLLFESPTPSTSPQREASLSEAIQTLTPESGTAFYARLARSGYQYGPSMRAVQTLYRGPERAVAHLRLPVAASEPGSDPSQSRGGLNFFRLHPSMLDGALQAVAGLKLGERPLLPFFIERIEIQGPLAEEMVAHVWEESENRYRLQLCQPSGQVAIRFSGICARPAADPLEGLFFRPLFQRLGPVNGRSSEQPPSLEQANGGILIVHRHGGPPLQRMLAALHPDQPAHFLKIGLKNRTLAADESEIAADDRAALDAFISELPPIGLVYFLAGLQYQDEISDPQAVIAHETRGIQTLFHLVQAFSHLHPGRELAIKAVTDGIANHPGAKIQPFAAQLQGFCRSAAREMLHIRFSTLDIELSEVKPQSRKKLERLAAAIAAEALDGQGRLISIRDDQRYGQILAPVQLTRKEREPYRQGGTYVILGGAGGIGMVLARHLVQNYGANVALIGRRPAAQATEQLQQLRDLGGKALYLCADATDAAQIHAALCAVRDQFGAINGAVHSAMILQDRLIEHMSDEAFQAALAPKTRATLNFCQALEHDALDFLLLFSSLQSFVGGAGQSNYAAGCTFLDAFAAHWRARVRYPVKLIHWGYWGSVGVVASEAYRRRMTEMGLYSIEPKPGMAALDRALASDWDQLLIVRAETRLLEEIGVRFQPVWQALPPPAHWIDGGFGDNLCAQELGPEVELTMRKFDEFEHWCERWAPALLVSLGLDPASAEQPSPIEFTRRQGLQPKFAPLIQALFYMLEHSGHAARSGSGYLLTQKAFPDPAELESQGQAMDHPAIAAFVRLVRACIGSFDKVLRGEIPATEVLFPKGSGHLVMGVYKDNPIADYYNKRAGEWVEALIDQRLRLEIDEPIRILEVGAGTGGTTSALLEALDAYGLCDGVHYYFTDLSPALVAQARSRFGDRSWLECRTFDLEKEPSEQGFHPGAFDLVVAGNAIHATADIKLTLQRLKGLLRAGGWILLNELTADHRFATLTFGLLDGWWGFRDAWRRLPHAPLLETGQWLDALRENGFQELRELGPSGAKGQRQRLLSGRSDGQIALPKSVGNAYNGQLPDGIGVPRLPQEQAPFPEKRRAAPLPAKDFETTLELNFEQLALEHYCAEIARVMSQILELSPEDLDWEAPHQRFGVDSILAVDIVDKLNATLGLSLRSTDFFNFATILELATHIRQTYPAMKLDAASPFHEQTGQAASAPALDATALKARTEQPPPEPESDNEAAILELFRKLEAGEIDIEEAQRLIGERHED